MGREIERKFLIDKTLFDGGENRSILRQAYLSSNPACAVRVRIEGENAWLTVKGEKTGTTRAEFEYAIPVSDAAEIMKLAQGFTIEKIRHRIEYEGMTWEVDEFLGENQGLWLAEIELDDENQMFAVPPWLGREVTRDERYYNHRLAINPYSLWKKP